MQILRRSSSTGTGPCSTSVRESKPHPVRTLNELLQTRHESLGAGGAITLHLRNGLLACLTVSSKSASGLYMSHK